MFHKERFVGTLIAVALVLFLSPVLGLSIVEFMATVAFILSIDGWIERVFIRAFTHRIQKTIEEQVNGKS